MKLSELMTKSLRTMKPDDTINNAARVMTEANVGSIPVVDNGKLVGIVTDRDIVVRAVALGKDINSVKCRDCMSANVVTATPDTDAHAAADLMSRNQIRRLPVVDHNGTLVGIVALGDLATVQIHVNEAGGALSQISEPSHPAH